MRKALSWALKKDQAHYPPGLADSLEKEKFCHSLCPLPTPQCKLPNKCQPRHQTQTLGLFSPTRSQTRIFFLEFEPLETSEVLQKTWIHPSPKNNIK